MRHASEEAMDEPRQGAQQSANEIFAAATEEQRERAKRVAAERVAPPVAVSRDRAVYAGVALFAPLLVGILLINVLGFSPLSVLESKPTPEAARQEAEQLLKTLVADIEAFRTDANHLPGSLVEVGIPSRGSWSYTNAGNGGYRVEGTLYGQAVTFTGAATATSPKEGQ
jgi:hypothetical protein